MNETEQTQIGILKLDKKLVKNMMESNDNDFIKLAEHNGKEVKYIVPVQPAISRELLSIYLLDFDMTLQLSQIQKQSN